MVYNMGPVWNRTILFILLSPPMQPKYDNDDCGADEEIDETYDNINMNY